MSAHLPMSRIKTIIKSSSDVEVVGKESTYIITRAAELFIKQLANQAYKQMKPGRKMEYRDVSNVVNTNNRYEFLQEIIPRKITVKEYYKIMKEKGVDLGGNLSESESSSSESSSSEEEKEQENEEVVNREEEKDVSDVEENEDINQRKGKEDGQKDGGEKEVEEVIINLPNSKHNTSRHSKD